MKKRSMKRCKTCGRFMNNECLHCAPDTDEIYDDWDAEMMEKMDDKEEWGDYW